MINRIAAASAALFVALIPVAPAAAAADPSCPQVVTHRANPLAAPENTVPGIASVPATGSRAVEVDVQFTRTGFPVLMHDTTVDRTTNGTGPLSAMTQPQATQLLAQDYAPWKTDPRFAGTKVPYGYDFMRTVADRGLDVLLHVTADPTEAGMTQLARYIDMFGWRARSVVMSTAPRVAAMRVWQPGLTYWLIEYNGADTIRRGESVQALGVEGYAVPFRDASAAAVAYWRSYGLQVAVWTADPGYDTAANWRAVRAAGADVLITNQPAQALASLGCSSTPATPTRTPTPVLTSPAPTTTPTDDEPTPIPETTSTDEP